MSLVDARSESIHQQLRRETAPLHRSLEDRLDLLGADLDRPRYLQVLAAFLGYYAPMEKALAPHVSASALGLPPWTDRLEQDLLTLGLPPEVLEALPRCRHLPPVDGPDHLAGCLYVLEGAALGGSVIAREVDRRLGIGPPDGAAFFVGEGQATGSRWRSFLTWLEAQGAAGDRRAIVDAASTTFRTFGNWLETRGVLR